MKPLSVIAGFGGINAAGRSSAHHAYLRTIIEVLDLGVADATFRALAGLMGIDGDLDDSKRRYILEHTLVRGIEPSFLDVSQVGCNTRARLGEGQGAVTFEIARRGSFRAASIRSPCTRVAAIRAPCRSRCLRRTMRSGRLASTGAQ